MFQFSWGLVDRPPARPYVNQQVCHGHLCQFCYGWQFHSFRSVDQSVPMQGLWRNLQKEDSGICFPLTRHLRIRIAIENTTVACFLQIWADMEVHRCKQRHFHFQSTLPYTMFGLSKSTQKRGEMFLNIFLVLLCCI